MLKKMVNCNKLMNTIQINTENTNNFGMIY